MKKFLTVLFLTGLLTASIAAAENSVKTAGTGKAILGISPDKKEITVRAVTADGSPVQVEGCTVTELPSDEETILTATGTKVVLKGALIELVCYANKLTALDIHGLTALQGLDCQNNMLTSLDVRELTGLDTLYCGNNRLTALDIHGLTALQKLYCNGNEIASLDVQGLTALQWLVCSDNQLTALNVQGLPALQALVFQHNRLEEDALIRILNSLPDRKTDEEGLAVFYTEDDNRSEGNYTDWSSSAGLQAAIKTARAKNWTLYKQVGGEDFEELEVTEKSERGTGFGGAAVPIDKTYTVKGVSFTMKGITAVTDAVLGDNSMEDNQEHSVSLSAYYIGETEVTQELWLAVMGNNPSYFDGSQNSEPAKVEAQGKRPVENVTWFDCIAFCNELTKKAGLGDSECVYYSDAALSTVYTMSDANSYMVPQVKWDAKGFRLPTEAEWEWAAKGGKEYRWAGTDEQDELKKYAWYAWYDDSDGGDANNKTHEVKQKQANGYGLYDMSGNVWEWCWDWYDDNTPAEGHDLDGVGAGSVRVIRGGSWFNRAIYAACASRDISNPVSRCDFLGLRVAYSVGR